MGGARDGEEQREQVDDPRGDDAAQPTLVEVVVHPREEGVQVRDGLPLLLGPVLQQRAHLHLHGAHQPLRVALTCRLHGWLSCSRVAWGGAGVFWVSAQASLRGADLQRGWHFQRTTPGYTASFLPPSLPYTVSNYLTFYSK